MRCEVLSLSSHHDKGQHGCDKPVLAFIDGCKWIGNFLTDNREKQTVSVTKCSLVRLDALFFTFCANRCQSAGYGRKLWSGDAVLVSRFAIDALSSLNTHLVVSRSVFLRGATRHLSCRDRAFAVSRDVPWPWQNREWYMRLQSRTGGSVSCFAGLWEPRFFRIFMTSRQLVKTFKKMRQSISPAKGFAKFFIGHCVILSY